jgi:hypothetical protein
MRSRFAAAQGLDGIVIGGVAEKVEATETLEGDNLAT